MLSLCNGLAAGIGILIVPQVAVAQSAWTPGAEIVGQSVQVQTAGVTNTVYFDAGGTARIITPAGNVVPATWSAGNQQLCLMSGGAQECWPYQSPFQAGQQMTLTSSCQATSSWVANGTNPMQQAEPVSQPERG
ncbi:MAG: hypothetical protein LH465_03955 [Sphingomonas bacterium]|nr:hypothetical protein [Sphingomonas bacterium]